MRSNSNPLPQLTLHTTFNNYKFPQNFTPIFDIRVPTNLPTLESAISSRNS
ncbi:hypothetical protein AAZX31_03G182400 [Glycine max]